ncbi:MAG: FAD-dependent oxidoreductase, partial [Thermoplasmata archaeon]|nr:FAD-dependent oxidoreductase [Thermoplasmata archaeon]
DITFVTGKRAGADFTPESLLQQGYLAVFVAVGAWDPRGLGIPGEHLPGVFSALHFLLAMNHSAGALLGRPGRKVVVIGGGDVALDAARSCRRLPEHVGVTVVYRKEQGEMTAGPEELEGGELEGVEFRYQRIPLEILGKGHVEGIRIQATQTGPPDASGKPTVIPLPGSEEVLPCDTVIVAVGEKADVTGLPVELDFKFGSQGWPQGKREDWMTDIDGVFAGGGKSVVYAMAAGYKAADAIEAFLAQRENRAPRARPDPFGGPEPPKIPPGYGGPSWHL